VPHLSLNILLMLRDRKLSMIAKLSRPTAIFSLCSYISNRRCNYRKYNRCGRCAIAKLVEILSLSFIMFF